MFSKLSVVVLSVLMLSPSLVQPTADHALLLGDHAHLFGDHAHLPGDHAYLLGNHAHLPGHHAHFLGNHAHLLGHHAHFLGNHAHLPGHHTHLPGDTAHLPPVLHSVLSSTDGAVSAVAALVGLDLTGLNVPIGLGCSPITVIGNNCGSTTVNCEAPKEQWGSLIAINCIPITL
ncbi:hypothetical protein B0H13DRAFT_2508365 [Mycena leptocephala]|nr:hypothetical protein B0H13DRAFT_2508365 [Mycena leptocephala]